MSVLSWRNNFTSDDLARFSAKVRHLGTRWEEGHTRSANCLPFCLRLLSRTRHCSSCLAPRAPFGKEQLACMRCGGATNGVGVHSSRPSCSHSAALTHPPPVRLTTPFQAALTTGSNGQRHRLTALRDRTRARAAAVEGRSVGTEGHTVQVLTNAGTSAGAADPHTHGQLHLWADSVAGALACGLQARRRLRVPPVGLLALPRADKNLPSA